MITTFIFSTIWAGMLYFSNGSFYVLNGYPEVPEAINANLKFVIIIIWLFPTFFFYLSFVFWAPINESFFERLNKSPFALWVERIGIALAGGFSLTFFSWVGIRLLAEYLGRLEELKVFFGIL